ncbi:MAG: hypothetical protein H0T46_14435 [Deltaproteobacteria bacterium]|nr:hypothetical protein [Deltaproteobacteria bacterium]
MSLAIVGEGASYEFRWRRWALLQDTVAAHLDTVFSGPAYPRLEAIGQALALGSIRIPARELGDEIERLRQRLKECTIDMLRIGARTAAVLYPVAHTGYRSISPVELAQLTPVGSARDLAEYFSSMLDSFADVCAKPYPDGSVEVFDG